MNRILHGDVLKMLRKIPARSVSCVITSPPYWNLRDYGINGQVGLERTPDQYVRKMVRIFRQIRRVLRDDGTCWVNMGDTYANKSEPGQSSPMKRDRRKLGNLPKVGVPAGYKAKDLIGVPWRLAFALQADGWYLRQDIIWHKPEKRMAQPEPMILAGCPRGGIVLDPFFGAGTTGVVALRNGRKYLGIEINKKYIEIAKKRLSTVTIPML